MGHPLLGDYITERDQEILEHLTQLTVQQEDDVMHHGLPAQHGHERYDIERIIWHSLRLDNESAEYWCAGRVQSP